MNWDWGSIFNISFTTDFWFALVSIIFINIILNLYYKLFALIIFFINFVSSLLL